MPQRHVLVEGERRDVVLRVLRNIVRPCHRSPELVGQFHVVAGHQQYHPNVLQQLPVGCPHRIYHKQHVVCCLNDGNLNEITGEAVEEDFHEGIAVGGPIMCKCWFIVHRALKHCMVIDAVPPPLLPFQECPPIDRGCVATRNILRGWFIVIVDLKTHVPNEGNIFFQFCALKTAKLTVQTYIR
jgi:hypothetical protein